jgi:GH15 family glucan-1,4-alpha-glucosidase
MVKYQPIENYGVIGDLNTAALVSLSGSIDFMCFPHFDSPSIFAALLDDQKGGKFEIGPLYVVPFQGIYILLQYQVFKEDMFHLGK